MPSKQATQKTAPKAKSRKPAVSNVAKLDAENPIPFEGGRAFSFVQSVRYLPFLAPKDDYAQNLLEARLLSDTHNACVVTKRDYCAGVGIHDVNGKDLAEEVLAFFRSMNLKNENFTKLTKKILESHFTYGNTPIELVRFTVGKEKRFFVYVHNFLEWRLCEPNEDDIVTHAVQSKLFLRKGYLTADEIKKSKKLPLYNPRNRDKDNWHRDEKGVERTLIWYLNPVTGIDHYGLPSALSSMIYQILEYKGARYDLDNFDNNLVLGGLLALKGNLSDGEANRIARQIIATHTGDGKRGRVAVVASEEGIDASSFHNYDTAKDGSYIQADDKWMQKIILANQWDAILAGIISPSTLGKGSGFLTKIYEIKLNTVIKPQQRELMEDVWGHIFKLAQEWTGLKLDDYAFGLENAIDISGLTDVDITPAVQVNEVRQAKGLPEDPAMKGKYMKSTGPQEAEKNKNQKEEADVQD